MRVLEGTYAIHRLAPDAPLPALAPGDGLVATVRTAAELSVVCRAERIDLDGVTGERSGDWSALEVAGPLDLSLTGVAARFTAPLAAAGVPVFVVSSYDTDYVLLPCGRLESAVEALGKAGIEVIGTQTREQQ